MLALETKPPRLKPNSKGSRRPQPQHPIRRRRTRLRGRRRRASRARRGRWREARGSIGSMWQADELRAAWQKPSTA